MGIRLSGIDQLDSSVEGCLKEGTVQFDELNSRTQSAVLRMLRKNDYKDMQGRGELFNHRDDPSGVNKLFEHTVMLKWSFCRTCWPERSGLSIRYPCQERDISTVVTREIIGLLTDSTCNN